MKTILALVLFLVGIADAAISAATKPHTIDSAATPKVSYVDDNDEALLDKLNEVIDTANTYLGGGVSAAVLSTTGDQRLTIDSDNNGSNRWFVTSGGTSDTLLRILEGGAWATYGAGTGTKLTLSDSILAATARISGNGYFGGTLTAVGATSLAGLSATTGAFSSNVTVGGTLGVTGASTIAALSATTGSFSSTLGVTGLITATGGILPGQGSDGAGRIFQSSVNGLKLRGVTGSTNDFYIAANDNSLVMRNPTGTSDAIFGNSVSTGSSFTSYGVGSLGSTDYERASIIHTGSAAELRSQAGGTGTVEPLRLVVGSTTRYEITNAGAHAITGAATFSTNFTQSDGTHTVSVTDNTADAVDIQQGSNNYINLTTANGAEVLAFGNASTNPAIQLLGTGAKSIDGAITASSTGTWTGKLGTADSLYAEDGLRVGSVSASNVNWNRSGANMWHTPDSVTVAGRLAVSDSISIGGNEKLGYDEGTFSCELTGFTTTVSGTCSYLVIGKLVSITIPALSGTSDSTGMDLIGLPAGIGVPTIRRVPIMGQFYDNTAETSAIPAVRSDRIAFSRNVSGVESAWTASGTKAVNAVMVITYNRLQ